MRVLITGSEGYLGQALIRKLATDAEVFGIDLRSAANPTASYHYQAMDIRDAKLNDYMQQHGITHVVHLASVLQASNDRQRDYDIDVNGTKNVLRACLHAGVKHLTVTSSGAAYGYHADNPEWLTETDPLRGNESFAYSCHKRLVEELLAEYRQHSPQLKQLILRPGTILGATTRNQITQLFQQKRLLAIKGSASPFVFIWDQDVIEIIRRGVSDSKTGIFNLAGDGAMPMAEIADELNKPLLQLPAWLLKLLLTMGHKLHLTNYSAEQLDFLRYRPVLDNRQLKQDFGYTPQLTTREVFAYYCERNH
ncbi:N-acetyl-alpha-D-glucosaminyl-diphospho-ditrans, octacis-undecaprenol 4-epimerase [Pseudidiomarina piscicola]|uniref:N-acetyl-alpha-D-glucosaminyl-diphospho-ditrans, octacis-undecaprenol 4-epimerase n=1 Tax=Pseudidiomarina piscicola TaxID=2614830 RepID=A0A6S6WLU7_9GAMM|nr:SDR family oxidoreductase [Pseudidiomarina piscicola]CAB0150149.1 N-acetyl-alpha-D-glucosaminyl-diphospho-ditrans, octacis-undecaprenol 4-epimerase [Pseudidiomarina piscicola]VZT39588.1 N-acetyl-alpha-D-glucosaminyl-diphospho-ditrans, octacis-undecaprenol 4-epimerase [Pseudomonas aeruginosa]